MKSVYVLSPQIESMDWVHWLIWWIEHFSYLFFMITDHTQVGLDCQGAQDNEDTLEEGLEDIARPEIDFSE